MPSRDFYEFKGESINENEAHINLLTETLQEIHNLNQQMIVELNSETNGEDSQEGSKNEPTNENIPDEKLNKIAEKDNEIHRALDELLKDNELLRISLRALRETMDTSKSILLNTFEKRDQSIANPQCNFSDTESALHGQFYEESSRGSTKGKALLKFIAAGFVGFAVGVCTSYNYVLNSHMIPIPT